MSAAPSAAHLVLRCGARLVGIPVGLARAVMRALPLRPLPLAPPWLAGLARIRGVELPVVSLSALLGEPPVPPRRFAVVRSGSRDLALACAELDGVRILAGAAELPPLARAGLPDCIAAIAAADREVVALLDAARLVAALPVDGSPAA